MTLKDLPNFAFTPIDYCPPLINPAQAAGGFVPFNFSISALAGRFFAALA
jgi:hypothetical protein